MKKCIIGIILGIMFIGLVSAGLTLFPRIPSEAGSYIEYEFNFTTNADCTGVLLSYNEIVHLDSTGLGFLEINISSLNTTIPNHLCEYRDGALRKVHSFSDIIFNSIRAKNITAEFGNFTGNVTADYFKGLFNWVVGDNYAIFNGSTWTLNETTLNNTIDSRTSGNFTGNQIYGEMWFFDLTRLLTTTSKNIWYNVTGFDGTADYSGSNLNGFSQSNNELVCNVDGLYKVDYSYSFS